MAEHILLRHRDVADIDQLEVYLAQRAYGYLTSAAIEEVAELVQAAPTQVGSLVGFYTLYHDQPGGKVRMQICTDLPCALRGAETFTQAVCRNLGLRVGETTPDGKFTLEPTHCNGTCAQSPMIYLDDTIYGQVKAEDAPKILEEWQR